MGAKRNLTMEGGQNAMGNKTWGDVEKEYKEYDKICERHNLDVEDIEAEVDGSVDAWVRQSDAAIVIVKLEKALKYCQDDKLVMQNQIDVLEAKIELLQESVRFYNSRSSLL